jgi:uncharacterized OB-fold protein
LSKTTKGCACTQNLRDLLRAYAPKKNPLIKIVCSGCGKLFWTNFETAYCSECNAKKKEKQQE